VWVLLCNDSKDMLISSAESCDGIHTTSDTWAVTAVKNKAKLEGDVWHQTLHGNREGWTMGFGPENLDSVYKNSRFFATSGTNRSGSGTTSDPGDQQANKSSIKRDGHRLKDLLPNTLFAYIIEVTVVGGD
jgi:hypothetical protein